MLDIQIDRLQFEISNAAGNEHRIGPIAARAAAIFAARLEEQWPDDSGPAASAAHTVAAAPVNVHLKGMSDEHVARKIAEAWLEAVALKLKP